MEAANRESKDRHKLQDKEAKVDEISSQRSVLYYLVQSNLACSYLWNLGLQ